MEPFGFANETGRRSLNCVLCRNKSI